MKSVTLTCAQCAAARLFRGTNIDELLAAILLAGWQLGPDMCPSCCMKKPEPTGDPE